ncbi:MAG: aminotransferase class I/II-fold pyridoxal phosphate-dependent enzyme [Candidatus Didemnitutus sp.]|nr:aminotransferase class I/II-fold pyridoxal phosphate-dependent enzyme [Candidatus Didemnitutus sp.]
MANPRIHLSSPHMGGDELALVQDAFATNWIAPLGPHVDKFEQEFAELVGGRIVDEGGLTSDVGHLSSVKLHAAALSSGTAALHLAMRWLKLEPGDEVICSSLTFSASVNPILYERATPVFVDCDKQTWNMDPAILAEAIAARLKAGRKPRAVILVHLYGQSADLDPIVALCAQHEIPLIEDAAEALGATYKGRAPGSFGLCGIHSFNGNKIITTSGGGMLTSADPKLIEKARFWATQARDPAPHYQHSEVGFNYRLSNVLAAIGRGQLRVLEDRVAARRRNCAFYQTAFADLPGIAFMPEADYGRCTRWLTCLTIDPREAGVDREQVRLSLGEKNIEARPVWKPMHLQPIFRECPNYGGAVGERLFADGLCLPSGSNLTMSDLERVVEAVRDVFKRR